MQPTHALASVLTGLLAMAATMPAQGPDVLIPSGSIDGAFALVDKDKDGKYTTTGESWDYMKALVNSSPRNYVLVGKRFYFPEEILDQIVWVEDTNGNGKIDEPTERHVFYDVLKGVNGTTTGFITLGANGWLWWINDGGDGEGIYRSKDLNNDGDAEDPGETLAVLTETMTQVKIENTPLTTAKLSGTVRTLSTTEIDSIVYDATYGTYGRFLVEDEWTDQVLAFEDKNDDGDFNDPGECYLFCALYPGSTVTNPRTTVIDWDANPDVISGKLPISNEVTNVAIDVSTNPTTYYLMSGDTGATQVDAAIIFKAQDKNGDGDANDAGETTIFWDGSLNSTGAVNVYNFTYGMSPDATGGVLYVNAEFDAAVDNEHLIRISDRDNDGDANDAGETTVLWSIPVDRTHYIPSVFPAGTLSALSPQTTLTEIRYYGAATCASSLPGNHNIQFGTSSATAGSASSKSPHIGNANWLLRTWGANPNAAGAYAIGVTKIPAGVPIGAGGTCNVYQSFDVIGLGFKTDAAGVNDQVVAVPNDVNLLGLWTYWQSIVVDINAPSAFGLTVSDAFEAKVGDWTFTDY